eukprot:GHVU01230734.1.p1 GENE.GHVU01230734.1~~GHVU01230734.1.p1  ORF type:complete len:705 (+),score=115.56 GHVU01230734.1:155-2269(+)
MSTTADLKAKQGEAERKINNWSMSDGKMKCMCGAPNHPWGNCNHPNGCYRNNGSLKHRRGKAMVALIEHFRGILSASTPEFFEQDVEGLGGNWVDDHESTYHSKLTNLYKYAALKRCRQYFQSQIVLKEALAAQEAKFNIEMEKQRKVNEDKLVKVKNELEIKQAEDIETHTLISAKDLAEVKALHSEQSLQQLETAKQQNLDDLKKKQDARVKCDADREEHRRQLEEKRRVAADACETLLLGRQYFVDNTLENGKGLTKRVEQLIEERTGRADVTDGVKEIAGNLLKNIRADSTGSATSDSGIYGKFLDVIKQSEQYAPNLKAEGETLGQSGETGKPSDVVSLVLLGRTGFGKTTCVKALRCGLECQTLEECAGVNFSVSTTEYDTATRKFVDRGQAEIRQVHSHLADNSTVTVHEYRDATGRPICRLVDTPGFLDNREAGQRDMNRQSIAEALTAFGGVNAILAFFPANETRLVDETKEVVDELMKTCGREAIDRLILVLTKTPLLSAPDKRVYHKAVEEGLRSNGIDGVQLTVIDETADMFRGNVAYINNDIIENIESGDFAHVLGNDFGRQGLSKSLQMGPHQLAGIVRMVQRDMRMRTPISTTVSARVDWVRRVTEQTFGILAPSLEVMNKCAVEIEKKESQLPTLRDDVASITKKIVELNVMLAEKGKSKWERDFITYDDNDCPDFGDMDGPDLSDFW